MANKGSLQIKGGKYYVVIPYKDDFGKHKTKWIATGLDAKNNRPRANQAMKEVLSKFNVDDIKDAATKIVIGDQILFCDFMRQWLESHRRNIHYHSYIGYKHQIDVIYKFFKHKGIMLKDLKPMHIQQFYDALDKKKLSGTTIQKYHVVIRMALQYALKNDLVTVNVADKKAQEADKVVDAGSEKKEVADGTDKKDTEAENTA